MTVIVSDSGPLISFARIDQLKLIEKMVNRVLIPPVVLEEIAPKTKEEREQLLFKGLRGLLWKT